MASTLHIQSLGTRELLNKFCNFICYHLLPILPHIFECSSNYSNVFDSVSMDWSRTRNSYKDPELEKKMRQTVKKKRQKLSPCWDTRGLGIPVVITINSSLILWKQKRWFLYFLNDSLHREYQLLVLNHNNSGRLSEGPQKEISIIWLGIEERRDDKTNKYEAENLKDSSSNIGQQQACGSSAQVLRSFCRFIWDWHTAGWITGNKIIISWSAVPQRIASWTPRPHSWSLSSQGFTSFDLLIQQMPSECGKPLYRKFPRKIIQ